MRHRPPIWALLIVAGYAGALAALLLWPSGIEVRRIHLDIYLFGLHGLGLPVWITPEWYAAVGNLIAPAGLSAALTSLDPRSRWPWWAGLVAAACVLAEMGQWLFLPGRDPEISDVVLNAAGALIGAGGVAMARRRRRARSDRGR